MRNIIWKRRISGTNTWLTVSKNDEVKLLWDNEHPMWSCHQCYNRHDHVVVNKQERECAIVDIAVAGDKRIVEKVKQYQELNGKLQECGTRELCRWYRLFRIIRKCDEELGEVAGKLDIRISISLPPKNYTNRNRKDFKKSIRVLE